MTPSGSVTRIVDEFHAESSTAPAPTTRPPRPGKLLLFSQVFVPDPAGVGQHMADVAFEMARRGWRVIVYTSRRGYDDPTVRYLPRQTIQGVDVRRLPLCSFGKKSIFTRILGTALFMVQALFVGLFTPRLRGIFFSTSPPLVGGVASLVGLVRRVPVAYWAMDLNPDQLIQLGKIPAASVRARFLEAVNRFILRRSTLVIALDRFMAGRLHRRGRLEHKLIVLPPWSPEDPVATEDADARPAFSAIPRLTRHDANPFRLRHHLAGKFVIMYSGNHSPSNPLATLLEATLAFRDDPEVRFLFVGGGVAKKDVEAFIRRHDLRHVLSLPTSRCRSCATPSPPPTSTSSRWARGWSASSTPARFTGRWRRAGRCCSWAAPSHVSDLLDRHRLGWQIQHGDVPAAVAAIRRAVSTPPRELGGDGGRARAVLRQSLGLRRLCDALCDALEAAMTSRCGAALPTFPLAQRPAADPPSRLPPTPPASRPWQATPRD